MKQVKEPDINIKVKDQADEVKQVDKQDEKEIRFEIESGRNSTHYVYIAKRNGGLLDYKIGIAGINHLARQRGGMQSPIDKCIINENKERWDIALEIIDTMTNSSAIGTFVQNKFDEFGNPDPYAKQICLSKARRNALAQLIPDKEKDSLIKDFVKQQKKYEADLKKKEAAKKKKKIKKQPKKKPVKKVQKKAVTKAKQRQPAEPELFSAPNTK